MEGDSTNQLDERDLMVGLVLKGLLPGLMAAGTS